ncbi:cytochrome c oxidase subunit 3 [Roseicella aquatilis]|uniref:Cytochrome-c oxidase n=1 Tax=Roseicella aquatilis TaxID=2527868 RepID=A0A4R4DS90_9PROT|nr:cytochrome c oxidase subunit 3 [Roseicella aquatilis]TCZ65459.1 cytochrome-c oxidase [Roseicella aquatilis]
MIVTLAVFAGLAAVAAWWLVQQGLAEKPWLGTQPAAELVAPGTPRLPTAKIGLGIFLAVAGLLLSLIVSSYVMRMEMADWRPLPRPALLWANTGVLVLSSLALHWAVRAARRGDRAGVQDGMVMGGLTALLFLAGQFLAWRQLSAAGYRPATGPADAFFYLITAVHGLHLLGGLVALGRAGVKLARGAPMHVLRLSVELCATYWHFLLLAWLCLFAVLAYAPSVTAFLALCIAPFR